MGFRGLFRLSSIATLVLSLALGACTRTGSRFSFSNLEGDPAQLAGTDVGNPKKPTKAAITILGAVCDTLARCQQVDRGACLLGVPTVQGMDQALGLPPNSYGQFSNLIGAEAQVSILGSMPYAQSCATEIESLSCSDPSLKGAYSSVGNPFGSVSNLVPQSGACPKVFGSALQVSPWSASLAPGKSVTLQASGGTPPYTFTVEPGGVGGSISPLGAQASYQAPAGGGGTATVTIRDASGQVVQAVLTVVGKTVTQIRLGNQDSCAIVNGELECWGTNAFGQLGDGTTMPRSSPVRLNPAQTNVAGIAMISDSTCSVSTAGSISCWGDNSADQLGDGSTLSNRTTAGLVAGSLGAGGAYQVFTGMTTPTVCASSLGNALYCWGSDAEAQLDDGITGANQPTPLLIAGIPAGVTDASAGANNACAIAGGLLFCWGSAPYMGQPNGPGTSTAIQVPLPYAPYRVSVGQESTCVILVTGALYCWGKNTMGDVGDGSGTFQMSPQRIFGSGVTAVSVGFLTACAVVNGGVQCWGANDSGEVGLDTGGVNVTTPYTLPAALFGGPVDDISVGFNHVCALSMGAVKCWGANSRGQLGNGTTTPSVAPVLAGPWL
jgi:alpha-tubulin suppressor-like RCC1 family protein